MSRRPAWSSNRYLGNYNDTEVHDLDNEKASCLIDQILSAGYAVRFNPDSLEEAHRRGCEYCSYCIGRFAR